MKFGWRLGHPRGSAVGGMYDCAEFADRPSLFRCHKVDAVEHVLRPGVLAVPGPSTIGGMSNHVPLANQPSLFIRNKENVADIIPDISVNLLPRLPSVFGYHDGTALSDGDSTVLGGELDVF